MRNEHFYAASRKTKSLNFKQLWLLSQTYEARVMIRGVFSGFKVRNNHPSNTLYLKYKNKLTFRYDTECNGVLVAPLISMKLY